MYTKKSIYDYQKYHMGKWKIKQNGCVCLHHLDFF